MVIGVQQPAIRGDEDDLGGGGAGVDAQIRVPLVSTDVQPGRGGGVVPGGERIVVRLALKQRGHGVHHRRGGLALLQQPQQLVERPGLVVRGAQGCPHGGKAVAVLGEDGVIAV